MIFVVLLGIGLALAGQVWHTAMQREKEKELLFVGDQFQSAIAQYYEGSPGGVKKFPASLEDLLEDRRYPTAKRHLRKIYRDPMTGEAQWGLIESPMGGIMGVHSLSALEPRKIAGFRTRNEEFAGATSYTDWKFGYIAAVVAENGAAPPANVPVDGVLPDPASVVPPTQVIEATVPSKNDPNRKRICENFSRTDRGTCAFVRFRDGADAGPRCDQSAAARNEACMNALPLPPLAIPIAE